MRLVIKCPECGYEYLPGEIYYPCDLGNPHNITRDMEGKIIFFDGASLDTEGEYRCDNCNTYFKVEAKVNFFTAKDPIKNKDGYVIKLNNNNNKNNNKEKEIEQNDLWEDK